MKKLLYTKDLFGTLTTRAVQIKLLTARVLCRASYRVLEYSTDTENSY